MILLSRARLLVAVAFVALAVPAVAQEVSDTHLKAARRAIEALNATDQFDLILPEAASALKAELIQKNPDLQAVISAVVDEKTFELVVRRSDLEREAALAYARVFSEEDLTQISVFYESPAGQKLISDGPIVTRKVIEAAQIWQRGIARDLAQAVGQQLATVTGASTPVAPEGAEQPAAEGTEQPAEDGAETGSSN
ncbi:MAG: DUF2059 domain-containing protein [Rhizobiaceae bacterium]